MSKVALLQAGNQVRGIIPSDFDGAYRIAKAATKAGYRPMTTPYGCEDPSPEEQEAAATMIIMAGLEIGLPPTQALEVIAIINGRRCIWGDGIPALLWSNGFKLHERIDGTGDGRVAVCTVVRPDGEEITRSFSVAQAKKAGLWDTRETVKRKRGNDWKDVPNDAPWFKYDERMLQMRARGWASRDGASDVLRGLRVAEEERDHERTMKDITPKTDPIEIPDIPDEIPDTPEAQVSDEAQEEPDTIADVNGFLKMIRDRLKEGYSPADIYESFGDMAERLPEDARGKFEAMLDGAA